MRSFSSAQLGGKAQATSKTWHLLAREQPSMRLITACCTKASQQPEWPARESASMHHHLQWTEQWPSLPAAPGECLCVEHMVTVFCQVRHPSPATAQSIRVRLSPLTPYARLMWHYHPGKQEVEGRESIATVCQARHWEVYRVNHFNIHVNSVKTDYIHFIGMKREVQRGQITS